MKDRIDLGIRTSARRVDRCSRGCTRGVQRIRLGILQSTESLGRDSQVGTAHALLSEIQRVPVSAMFRLSDRSNNFVALFKLDIARGHAGPHFRDDPPWKVLVRWISFVVNSSRNFQVLKSQQLQVLPRVAETVPKIGRA